jgi:hypothetical protein
LHTVVSIKIPAQKALSIAETTFEKASLLGSVVSGVLENMGAFAPV